MSLDELRQRLSAVDAELIALIAERQRIVAEVSAHKIATGTPTRDFGREADILKRVQQQSSELGLDSDVAVGIMRLLIRSSLTHQERTRVAAGCRVTSIHPMFGPDTRLLSERHVIFVDVGVPAATAEARSLFESTMAERVEMSLDEHDRLIGYVLGLSHALNLAFFTALAGSGELVPHLKRLSSTTFDAQLDVARRVAGDNPHLYFEIQALNDYGRAPLDALVSAAGHVRDLVAGGDEAGFVELMKQGRRYLDPDD